jgi:hypothetical protein
MNGWYSYTLLFQFSYGLFNDYVTNSVSNDGMIIQSWIGKYKVRSSYDLIWHIVLACLGDDEDKDITSWNSSTIAADNSTV